MIFELGSVLPDARIATVGGRSFAFGDLLGRPVLVYGWASWSSSRAALSSLQAFHLRTGLDVASVAFDVTGVGAPMEHLKKAGASHHILVDSTCTLTRKWGVRKIPFVVLLDEESKVIGSWEQFDEPGIESVLSSRPDPAKKSFPSFEEDVTARQFQVEIRLQACTNLLGRGRVADAKASLEKALELDADNDIIRGQLATL